MEPIRKLQRILRKSKYTFLYQSYRINRRCYHQIPFLDLYEKTTGQKISIESLPQLKKKHPHIDTVSEDRLQCTLKILEKFSITPLEACQNPHVFSMNPITMDNYGEILKECGFVTITPINIIRYHTLVRSRTIEQLKNKGYISKDNILEEKLQNIFEDWPQSSKTSQKFCESKTSILSVRMSVLQNYLNWRLCVSSEEFQKYCRNYLTLKHKPMTDILEALNLAFNQLNLDAESIRRNGFIIATDPVKTKLILENVKILSGLDIREAIKIEPAILRNTHTALLEINKVLEEYEIPKKAQQRCLKVYCMRSTTVRERLEELMVCKEYQVLSTNPRVLLMVLHKRKMMARLNKIQDAKKQCYSLNNLVASRKVFNNYISGFGNKVCGRDIAILINTSLQMNNSGGVSKAIDAKMVRTVKEMLKRHKYWLHAALEVVDENIQFLKNKFDNQVIFNHCQLLLYPVSEINYYLEYFLSLRNGVPSQEDIKLDASYNNLKYSELTDNQILSLVLYEIEKKYHFSCDGIWSSSDGPKADSQAA